MENGFRRIALAQGLLPEPPSSNESPRWTDAALSALLQIPDPAPQGAREPCDPPAFPSPADHAGALAV